MPEMSGLFQHRPASFALLPTQFPPRLSSLLLFCLSTFLITPTLSSLTTPPPPPTSCLHALYSCYFVSPVLFLCLSAKSHLLSSLVSFCPLSLCPLTGLHRRRISKQLLTAPAACSSAILLLDSYPHFFLLSSHKNSFSLAAVTSWSQECLSIRESVIRKACMSLNIILGDI